MLSSGLGILGWGLGERGVFCKAALLWFKWLGW